MRGGHGAEARAVHGGVHGVDAMSKQEPRGGSRSGELGDAKVDDHDRVEQRLMLDGPRRIRAKPHEVVVVCGRCILRRITTEDVGADVSNHGFLFESIGITSHTYTQCLAKSHAPAAQFFSIDFLGLAVPRRLLPALIAAWPAL